MTIRTYDVEVVELRRIRVVTEGPEIKTKAAMLKALRRDVGIYDITDEEGIEYQAVQGLDLLDAEEVE